MFSKELLPDSNRSGKAMMLVALVIAIGIWAYGWFFVLSRLNHGIDISDTGYYLLNIFNHQQILVQVSFFGIIWDLISPFSGIVENRYWAFAFLASSFMLLTAALYRVFFPKLDWSSAVISLCITTLSVVVYYRWWLPDPSYNLMALSFIALCWAALLSLVGSMDGGRVNKLESPSKIFAFSIGILISALTMVKISSAAVMGVFMVVFFLCFCWNKLNLQKVLMLALWAALGILCFFVVLALAGLSPVSIITQMQGGIATMSLMADSNLDIFDNVKNYFLYLLNLSLFVRPSALVFLLVLLGSLGLQSRQNWPKWRPPVFLLNFVAGSYLIFDMAFIARATNLEKLNWVFLFLILISAAYVFTAKHQKQVLLIATVLSISMSPMAFSFGTNNPLFVHLVVALSLPFAAASVASLALRKDDYPLFVLPVLACLFIAGWAVKSEIETTPYRMGESFENLTHIAYVGPEKEPLFVTQELAKFYGDLLAVRDQIDALEEPPVIIDLTGRVPMLTYQVGGRMPGSAWILSGNDNAAKVFEFIIGKLEPKDLKSAWIFYSPDYRKSFSPQDLNAHGLRFPDDYRLVKEVYVPYIKVRSGLYAPNPAQSDENIVELLEPATDIKQNE